VKCSGFLQAAGTAGILLFLHERHAGQRLLTILYNLSALSTGVFTVLWSETPHPQGCHAAEFAGWRTISQMQAQAVLRKAHCIAKPAL